MKECKYAKDYKGMRAPRCDEWMGCDACWEIYQKKLQAPHKKYTSIKKRTNTTLK